LEKIKFDYHRTDIPGTLHEDVITLNCWLTSLICHKSTVSERNGVRALG